MKKLESLYSSCKSSSDNPLCEGCTILEKSKPVHSVMDYEELPPSQVLFLSDSITYRFGNSRPFSDKEIDIIKECFPYDGQFAASVKCPSVKEVDMSPDNMKLCRVHLEATIDKVKPQLVYACGNLAMKMLIKKSGITNKRGRSYEFSTGAGHSCIVVPIFHPYTVIKEPRHKILFQTDIRNAYEKYILGKTDRGDFVYKILTTIEEVEQLEEELKETDEELACDIETTGLNFKKDSIQTIAVSYKDGTFVIPCDHKDSPFKKGEPHYARMWMLLRRILENPHNKKIFHNAKFDLKFLINHGIYPKNVWDTKIMHHMLDENLPKSLMDLVKLYFPTELESL